MNSRYDNKNAARERVENERRNKVVSPKARDVPRWLKKSLLQMFEDRYFGQCMAFFSQKFLPHDTIEVLWYGNVPFDVPKRVKIWKTVYRLQHRRMGDGDVTVDRYGTRPTNGIGCGFKYSVPLDPNRIEGGSRNFF